MPNLRRLTPVLVILFVAGALGYLGWTTFEDPSDVVCSACGRAVHSATRVEGVSGGEAVVFCCAACALRAESQLGGAVTITRVFDYESGNALAPENAVAVVGGDVNMCMREQVLLGAEGQAAELHFDRCYPSVLMFAGREAADQFRDQHGGRVVPFSELEDVID